MKSFKKRIQKRIILCKQVILLEKEEETFAASAANARILIEESNRIKESVRINDYIKGCASRDAEYEASLWP